jgi:hypothetical protein
VKGLDQYHQNATNPDGLYRHCKDCQRAYIREHYIRNREYYLDKARIRNRAMARAGRDLVRQLKDVPCADCGERFPSWVM